MYIVKYKVTLVRCTRGRPAVGLCLNSYCLEFSDVFFKFAIPVEILFKSAIPVESSNEYPVLWCCFFKLAMPVNFSLSFPPLQVEVGYRMPPPAECPEVIYAVMQKCWLYDEDERPNFSEILHMLKDAQKRIRD